MRKSGVEPLVFFSASGTAMADPADSDVTTVLHQLQAGNPEARQQLLNLVYDELRRMAAGFMPREAPDHSWQATDLVHETVARLLGADVLTRTTNRQHFFGTVARIMRQLLIEHVRLRKAHKRGGGWQRVPLDDLSDYFTRQDLDVLAVHEALERLAALNERQSQVVTLRYFGGFTMEEIAAQLDVSLSTVESDFRLARTWLHTQLR
jgi:RNA polymerase sigma-70 factor (ECF subfamily)